MKQFLKVIVFLSIQNVLHAQPLFKIPKPSCGSVTIAELTPDIYNTYFWDFGNNTTYNGHTPPPVNYTNPGEYTISLTVTSTTPFRVIDTVIITQHHPSSWVGNSPLCNDQLPDLFLEYLSYTTNSPFWTRTSILQQAVVPAIFSNIGIPTKSSFPLTLWDKDDGIWCGASDFLGEITVPANTMGGIFSDPDENLTLTIKTKMVNSTIFHQTFTLENAPTPPVVTCSNDTLYASYNTNVQWLNESQNPIPNAINKWYKPTVAGIYYVRFNGDDVFCPSISEAYSWAPGCMISATADLENRALSIYPNPGNGSFYLSIPSQMQYPINGQVTSIDGKVVHQFILLSPETAVLPIELSKLAAGVYVVTIQNEHTTRVEKLTIIK